MKHLDLICGLLFMASSLTMAQTSSSQRIPLIGSPAPSFKAPSTNGPISFPGDFGDRWKILFAHPRDFTPVCSSEILDLAYRQQDFEALNTQIVVLSVDRMVSHLSWKSDLENIDFRGRGKVKIAFPLVVDSSYSISYRYGMVDTQGKLGPECEGRLFYRSGQTWSGPSSSIRPKWGGTRMRSCGPSGPFRHMTITRILSFL